ncbi:hypothetical protein JCM21900_004843 [Sporobolomyces salmonicolor]
MAVPAASNGSTTPASAPPIPLYHQSSQYRSAPPTVLTALNRSLTSYARRNWRYSKQELDKIREELNKQAVQRVQSLWEEERAQHAAATTASSVPADSSASTSEPPSNAPTPPPASEIEYLTVADEQSLVTYYLTQIPALCGAYQFPEMVQATAMTYLKRFYLRNTCMDYHPKNVMLTCLFLATKTENFMIPIDAFAAKIKTPPSDILSLEFLVSQSLRFEYKVHHAHLALSGLLLDLQADNLDLPTLAAAAPKAHSFVRGSRQTPAELIYTPSQIAAACLRLADPSLVDTWLRAKTEHAAAKKQTGAEEGEVMIQLLDQIGEMVLEVQRTPLDKAKVKDADRRLRWASNPEKDPKSALFKKRKAEEEAQREEKERAKAAKRPPNDDASVFD